MSDNAQPDAPRLGSTGGSAPRPIGQQPQPQQEREEEGGGEEEEMGHHLPRRHSSLSLPEEVVLGVSPPPPHDCEHCNHLHRQRSASQQHLHHHHHHHHHHQPPPLPLSPSAASPSSSPPPSSSPRGAVGLGLGLGDSGSSPGVGVSSSSSSLQGARDGLPPRLPLPILQQRQSSVLPRGAPDLTTSGPSAFAFSPSYQPPAAGGLPPPPPGPPAPSPHVGAYAIPQSPPPGIITKPHRIILVRHGESTGNVDENVYVTTPDWKVPLSPRGHEQARELGRKLKEIVGNEPLYVYSSPYVRTKQTLEGLLEAFEENLKVGIREEPRITEQQFGNFQHFSEMQQCKRQRSAFGRFYYRFPDGESGLDVYTRVTSFISTMFRDFADGHICRPDLNVIIVTHGLTLRLLLMRWFKLTVETFESTTNPPNGSFVVMSRKEGPQIHPGRSGGGVYELAPESAALISLSYNAVPVGPSLKTPTSGTTPTGSNSSASSCNDEADNGQGTAETGQGNNNGSGSNINNNSSKEKDGDVAAALTTRLRAMELQPSSLSLSGSGSGSREGGGD